MRLCTGLLVLLAAPALFADTTEERALGFLSREVPRWSQENHCYSCHNNGDAARALYAAQRLGYQVPSEALTETTAWLRRPLEWDSNKGDPNASDKRLARIQFSAALLEAMAAGIIKDRQPLLDAAEGLVKDQGPAGFWPVEQEADVGSPATYGTPLATFMAIRTLRQADAARFRPAIEKAEKWMSKLRVEAIVDCAAVLWAFAGSDDPSTIAVRGEALDTILRSQNPNGGWGSYPHQPSEAFDTAVTILALHAVQPGSAVQYRIDKGRVFLVLRLMTTGSWRETTRPAGSQSYAQRMSTAGWATYALVETRREGRPR